jgi:hypothetical protein
MRNDNKSNQQQQTGSNVVLLLTQKMATLQNVN